MSPPPMDPHNPRGVTTSFESSLRFVAESELKAGQKSKSRTGSGLESKARPVAKLRTGLRSKTSVGTGSESKTRPGPTSTSIQKKKNCSTSKLTPLRALTIRASHLQESAEHRLPGQLVYTYINGLPKFWFGVIFVRSGCYEGGVFRFTLTLPEKFPNDEVPIVMFNTPLYHPAVDFNSGVLNLNEVFPHWDKKRNHIWQILNIKSNKKLFMEKVKEYVSASVSHLYDEPGVADKHYITFKPYDPEVHEPAKISMLKTPNQEGLAQGTSWIEPGSFQPFSKNET
ncbi:AKT-interacting protein [Eumeta japonica]|uniref:AKT-interacting protein n=1 Tax=Eumeta variegata TaxID=151549 RepID=A0A4C1Y6U1_EUMVA|nr:AKT-interacting protein [Eumeta japonica]